MVISGCAVLQRVAEDIQQQGWSEAKMSSIERRLERFVANKEVVVTDIWKAFLAQVLPYWKEQKLTFVLDCMPYNAQFTIVYLGLLVHSRVLPVAWVVMPQQEPWQERQWDIVARLLETVRAVLPQTHCTLVADRGLAGLPLVRLCEQRHWHYVLRIWKAHTCRRQMGKSTKWSPWCSFKSFIRKKGKPRYGRALVWQEETIETYVSACWEEEYQEAWLIISDLSAGKARIHTYALRMRVESTFQDTKTRGWNIEAAQLKQRAHLDRLLLALFLAVWWVIWRLPASITDSVTALIAMIDATKASFVSDGSGSAIFCDAPPILLPSRVVYPSRNRRMDGASRYDSKYTFRSQKKCRGERGSLWNPFVYGVY